MLLAPVLPKTCIHTPPISNRRAPHPTVFVGVAVWLLDPWARSEHVPSRQDYRFLGLRQRVWSALANSMSFSVGWQGRWWPARVDDVQ